MYVVQWAVEKEMCNGIITVGAADTLCWVFFINAVTCRCAFSSAWFVLRRIMSL